MKLNENDLSYIKGKASQIIKEAYALQSLKSRIDEIFDREADVAADCLDLLNGTALGKDSYDDKYELDPLTSTITFANGAHLKFEENDGKIEFELFDKDDNKVDMDENTYFNIQTEVMDLLGLDDTDYEESELSDEDYEQMAKDQQDKPEIIKNWDEDGYLAEGKKKSEKKKKTDSSFVDSIESDVHDLKNKGLNLAQYAYRLYPDMDKATARSKFYKKMKHEKVKDGYSKKKTYKYSFTPSEAAKISNLTSKTFKEKK
jgi:hypothetical protein